MSFTTNTDMVFEGLDMTHEPTCELHLWEFFFTRIRIHVGSEVKDGKKTGESEPYVCVGEISTWADSTHDISLRHY